MNRQGGAHAAALAILHEDLHIIVVDKPAGMLIHPTARVREGTLLNLLEVHTGGFVRLPHRLDRETSGLVVAAKTPEALTSLGNQFLRRQVDKRYLALVSGNIAQDEMSIDARIGRDPLARPQWNARETGKPAETRLRVLDRRAGSTLVELTPVTGRTNQLRIHCAHIGHPIVGDVPYAGPAAERLLLHAATLEFLHPASGQRVKFHSASFPPETPGL